MTCYAVILADPPWKYRAWNGDRGMRTAESAYAQSFAEGRIVVSGGEP